MSEETLNTQDAPLEARSRALFQESVERIDMRTRSRLTQARHAALEAAERARPRAWFMRLPVLTSAAGVAAAAVLGVSLWVGAPQSHHVATSADSVAISRIWTSLPPATIPRTTSRCCRTIWISTTGRTRPPDRILPHRMSDRC